MRQKNSNKHVKFAVMAPAQLVESRVRLGLTQVELAGQLETDIRTYQRWEAGCSHIPGAAKVAVTYLLMYDGDVMAVIRERMEAVPVHDPRPVRFRR